MEKNSWNVSIIDNSAKHTYMLKGYNKFTVLTGDSGIGKSAIIEVLSRYKLDPSLRVAANINWQVIPEKISNIEDLKHMISGEDKLYIMDEEQPCLHTSQFLKFLETSPNYFLLIIRDTALSLPLSLDCIYVLTTSNKYSIMKLLYIDNLTQLYNSITRSIKRIILEDGRSGYVVFKSYYGNTCITAKGKDLLLPKLEEVVKSGVDPKDILVVMDGSTSYPVYNQLKDLYKDVKIFAPYCFEELILCSKFLNSRRKLGETAPDLKYGSVEQQLESELSSITSRVLNKKYIKGHIPKCFYTNCCYRSIGTCDLYSPLDKYSVTLGSLRELDNIASLCSKQSHEDSKSVSEDTDVENNSTIAEEETTPNLNYSNTKFF